MKYFFLLFLFLQSFHTTSQSYWVQSSGGISYDEGCDVAIDTGNNIYTTGYFSGDAFFNSIELFSSGASDIFISKNDPAGNYLWVVKAGGPNVDKGLSIKTDGTGNVYIAGLFSGTASFSGTIITSSGLQDVFVAKYNTNGILQWVRSGGGLQNDAGNGIAIDDNGNVAVTGQFIGTAQFGSFTLTSAVDPFTGMSSIDVFTIKYDISGNELWIKKGSSRFTDRGLDLACDPNGNIYVTGQFSDTVTFESIHNNTMYNSIFLIKYNQNGNEEWFRRIGGSVHNIANSITVDQNSNIYLTGDFSGNLLFLESVNAILTGNYPECIFVAKYDHDGALLWTHADGSYNDVSARSIALDDSSNVFITGTFKCKFSQYADIYGQGTFNSVGYNDVFTSKYNSNGNWQWSRNYGGQFDDYSWGIAINNLYQPIITGSYKNKLVIPKTDNFFFPLQNLPNPLYHSYLKNCFDSLAPSYYFHAKSKGFSDIFICNSFDKKAKPFYYYNSRIDSFCLRPVVNVSIGDVGGVNQFGPDTISFCVSGHLYATTHCSSDGAFNNQLDLNIGPLYHFLWSTGDTTANIGVYTSDMYYVTITSYDGCFTSNDSIYVNIHQNPPKPKITDGKGINFNTDTPQPISLCEPDSVLLTVNNQNNYLIEWHYQVCGGSFQVDSFTYNTLATNCNYGVTVHFTDSNGCHSFTEIPITVDSALVTIVPKPKLQGGINDTVQVCDGDPFYMFVYDSISDPQGSLHCAIRYLYCTWTVFPALNHGHVCGSGQSESFNVINTGSYYITCSGIRNSPCGGIDSFLLSKTVYVQVNPQPVVTAAIAGNLILCDGDSTLLTATGGPHFYWSGPGIISDPDLESVWVNEPGHYMVTVSDINVFGCSDVKHAYADVIRPNPPTISMLPANGLICPNDSVKLMVTGSGIYHWEGPPGPIGGNVSFIYATVPGLYYCNMDSAGCLLTSNILELKQYATPFLFAFPSTVICPGATVEVNVITNDSSLIQWQSPLSGNSPNYIITSPGIYSCNVTVCDILTNTYITITPSNATANISPPGPLNFCDGESVLLQGNPGMAMYQWDPGNSIDPEISVYTAGTYTLTTTDGYGCTAISLPVTITVDSSPHVQLDFLDRVCLDSSLKFSVTYSSDLTYSWSGPDGFSSTSNEVFIPSVQTENQGMYYLTVSNAICSSKDSISLEIENCLTIIIPNVITPNGDGKNDYFQLSNLDIIKMNCEIYNRWGNLVYKSHSITHLWDGKDQNGRDLSDGFYYYLIDLTLSSREARQLKGYIHLIR